MIKPDLKQSLLESVCEGARQVEPRTGRALLSRVLEGRAHDADRRRLERRAAAAHRAVQQREVLTARLFTHMFSKYNIDMLDMLNFSIANSR